MPDPQTARGSSHDATEGAPFTDGPSLLDVLDRVLERGIVVEASATGALPALDLTSGEASLTVASRETVAADAGGWDALAALVAETGAERATTAPPHPAPGEVWRSGEHAALKRQFERLNA